MSRRVFTWEFKITAVKLVVEEEMIIWGLVQESIQFLFFYL